MKYIVTKKEDGTEEMFLFPSSINHGAMAEVVNYIKTGDGRDWRRDLRTPIAAGFISTGTGNRCIGRSETLNLDSRPEQDTTLLYKTIEQQRAIG